MVVIIVVFLLDEREREREAVLNRYHYRIFFAFSYCNGRDDTR